MPDGFVIDGFEKGSLAAILYAGSTQPLFLFPRSLLTPTEEDYQTLSKSQLIKRQENPKIGDRYVFTADEGSNIIKTFLKDSKVDTVTSWGNGCAAYKTKCVISPSIVRQCWVPEFGIIKVPKVKMDYLLPNIPIHITILFQVDYGTINPEVDPVDSLDQLSPMLKFSFGKFGEAILNDLDDLDLILESTPWNRELRLPRFIYLDGIAPAGRTPHGLPLNFRTIGLVVAPNNIFCRLRLEEPFYLPTLKKNDRSYGIGSILAITVLWEPFTNRYIVKNDYRQFDVLRTRCQRDETLFLVDVQKSKEEESATYFFNPTAGLVLDPKGLLANETDPDAWHTVWAKYDGPRAKCTFSIVREAIVSADALDNARIWSKNEEELIKMVDNLDF